MESYGINPKLVKQFIKEHAEIAEQINEDLVNDLPPITYHRNNMMIAQVRLLMILLDQT